MSGIVFKQFSQPTVLREIGREVLRQFLEPFLAELEAKNLPVPPPDSSDTRYFSALAQVLRRPAEIPDNLSEALFAIEDLASPDGQERLQAAFDRAGLE